MDQFHTANRTGTQYVHDQGVATNTALPVSATDHFERDRPDLNLPRQGDQRSAPPTSGGAGNEPQERVVLRVCMANGVSAIGKVPPFSKTEGATLLVSAAETAQGLRDALSGEFGVSNFDVNLPPDPFERDTAKVKLSALLRRDPNQSLKRFLQGSQPVSLTVSVMANLPAQPSAPVEETVSKTQTHRLPEVATALPPKETQPTRTETPASKVGEDAAPPSTKHEPTASKVDLKPLPTPYQFKSSDSLKHTIDLNAEIVKKRQMEEQEKLRKEEEARKEREKAEFSKLEAERKAEADRQKAENDRKLAAHAEQRRREEQAVKSLPTAEVKVEPDHVKLQVTTGDAPKYYCPLHATSDEDIRAYLRQMYPNLRSAQHLNLTVVMNATTTVTLQGGRPLAQQGVRKGDTISVDTKTSGGVVRA